MKINPAAIITIASIITRTDMGKKNADNIPSPKQVIAKPTALLEFRIAFSPRNFYFFILLYVFDKKVLKILFNFLFFHIFPQTLI